MAAENLKVAIAQSLSVNELLWNQSIKEGLDMGSLIKESRLQAETKE